MCLALDCLPLAIELAAARVTLLTPAEMPRLLENRFALLGSTGSRGPAPRQQTLRATIDWSYELLEPAEQQLFRRLAVFVGPFDLAAATTMGGRDTLSLLGRPVDKSLVVACESDRHPLPTAGLLALLRMGSAAAGGWGRDPSRIFRREWSTTSVPLGRQPRAAL